MDVILARISSRVKREVNTHRFLSSVYLVNILLSFHYYLIIYINSSFLSQFFTPSQISVLYIVGSGLTLILLLNISKILEKWGNYRLIRYLIIAEILATFGLAFSVSSTLIAFYFIIFLVAVPVISFGFDLLLESVVKDETKTGQIRTTYLTLGNITIVIATFLVALILTDGNYYKVYLASLLFLIPLYPIMKKKFSHYIDGQNAHIKIKETVTYYLHNRDLYNVGIVHLLLQVFYAYMVIYTPIYLSQFIGFSWHEIALMFTIMLVPFIVFELPAGSLADKRWGEQEMMIVGCALMGFFTLIVSFITIKNFLLWTAVLFMTRVGAAIVEAMTDSYFFKKVNKNDTDTIGFYRMSGPASYIIAPILATLSLQFLSFNHIFIVLGALMIFGCHYALNITDTK